ncbi:MAG: pyridoxal phosphate-dependent aminotransferase, partial [Candidatus Binatia bacterium]
AKGCPWMMKLSERTKGIKPSITLALAAKAAAMRAQGIGVINFAAGEPDFDTPNRIKEAAVQALKNGMTKYTEVRGIQPLREAIAEKYQRDEGLKYDKDEVLVSCGGKHSLYNVFQAVLNDGDEVLIPAPYWVSYRDMALLAGAVPRIVETKRENGYRITPKELQAALGPRVRVFILNSPNNPTGAAYSRDELEALAQVLERHECFIISDDVYEKIVYDGFRFQNIVGINGKLRERTVIINSLSKTYAMTGWRIGYALGPAPLISTAAKIQSQSTSNPTSFAQAASVEALKGPQDEMREMVREFQRRRDRIVEGLNAMEGVECPNPEGAFYVFPRIGSLFGKKGKKAKIVSASDLTDFLLEEAQVVAVPGEDFGSADHVRFSYATSFEDIERGCDRIEAALKKLS